MWQRNNISKIIKAYYVHHSSYYFTVKKVKVKDIGSRTVTVAPHTYTHNAPNYNLTSLSTLSCQNWLEVMMNLFIMLPFECEWWTTSPGLRNKTWPRWWLISNFFFIFFSPWTALHLAWLQMVASSTLARRFRSILDFHR